MLLSPLILILLEASKSTWKSADPVPTRTAATLRDEAGCVVAVEVTRAVQEAAKGGVVFRRMEAVVGMCLVVDEHREANPRPHDPLVEYPK